MSKITNSERISETFDDFSRAHLPHYGRVRGDRTFNPEKELTFFFWRHEEDNVEPLRSYIHELATHSPSKKIRCLVEACGIAGKARKDLQTNVTQYINHAACKDSAPLVQQTFNMGASYEERHSVGSNNTSRALFQILRDVREATGTEIDIHFVDATRDDPEWQAILNWEKAAAMRNAIYCGPLSAWKDGVHTDRMVLNSVLSEIELMTECSNKREAKVEREIREHIRSDRETPILSFHGALHRDLYHREYEGLSPQAIYLVHPHELRLRLPARLAHDSIEISIERMKMLKKQSGSELTYEDLRDIFLSSISYGCFKAFAEKKNLLLDNIFRNNTVLEFLASRAIMQTSESEKQRLFEDAIEFINQEMDLDESVVTVTWNNVLSDFFTRKYLGSSREFYPNRIFLAILDGG